MNNSALERYLRRATWLLPPAAAREVQVFGPVERHDIAGRAVASLFPLFAKTQATPPCDGQSQPEQRVQYRGEVKLNSRWLIGQEP